MKSILSKNQKEIISIISNDKIICDNFYLTGGTALSEFYLHHRLSEDLDFFSENEFEPQGISIFFKKIKTKAKIKKVEYQQSFNRNLFFLIYLTVKKLRWNSSIFPLLELKKKKKSGICI